MEKGNETLITISSDSTEFERNSKYEKIREEWRKNYRPGFVEFVRKKEKP